MLSAVPKKSTSGPICATRKECCGPGPGPYGELLPKPLSLRTAPQSMRYATIASYSAGSVIAHSCAAIRRVSVSRIKIRPSRAIAQRMRWK